MRGRSAVGQAPARPAISATAAAPAWGGAASRSLAKYSKLYCFEQWLREEVFLPSGREFEPQHLYRAMDFLRSRLAMIN